MFAPVQVVAGAGVASSDEIGGQRLGEPDCVKCKAIGVGEGDGERRGRIGAPRWPAKMPRVTVGADRRHRQGRRRRRSPLVPAEDGAAGASHRSAVKVDGGRVGIAGRIRDDAAVSVPAPVDVTLTCAAGWRRN